MPEGFRKLGEREVYRGVVVHVGVGEFVSPTGEHFERDIVHHPGAVSVVPLAENGEVVLVRQYRSALDRLVLEIPAGKRDVDGEAPEVTAARELVEEVGLAAGRLEKLCEFANSPGFCDEWAHLYLARDLIDIGLDGQGVEEQHMTVERVRLDDVPTMIARGEIYDAKTIIGLLLTRDLVAREKAE